MGSNTIYEYQKIKPIVNLIDNLSEEEKQYLDTFDFPLNAIYKQLFINTLLKNRLDLVIIEFNKLARDFELYKKTTQQSLNDVKDLQNRVA